MKPIMLATDGSPTADEATKKAIELAKVVETELVIVTAWDIPYSTLGYAAIPPVGELLTYGKEQAEKVAGEAAAKARAEGVPAQTLVLRGFPVEEISAAAKRFEPQLLVLGSHGWGPMKRVLFGGVSTGVLHHASVPVLVVPATAFDGAPTHEEAREPATIG
jgi:nucleotide-binding universal stress UspA family protein